MPDRSMFLARRMRRRADEDQLPPSHPLRTRAAQLDWTADDYFKGKRAAVAVERELELARKVWTDYAALREFERRVKRHGDERKAQPHRGSHA